MTRKFLIRVNDLHKNYGELEVLKGLNFTIRDRRITFLAGPNGSGKTTLIKIILGLVKKTSGEVFFDNTPINGDHLYRSKIGYMPQTANFPLNLRVGEIIDMIKSLREDITNYDNDLFEEYKLTKELDKRVTTLSGGTLQKLNASIAFMFNPVFFILDEPTAGLDPISTSILKSKVNSEKQIGKTFLITSHLLQDFENLSEDILFLLNGELAFFDEKKKLLMHTNESDLENAVVSIMRAGK